MTSPPREDPRLTRVSSIALALPAARRAAYGDHATFDVRGKKFAYYLDNHHGDGIVSVCFKAEPGEQEFLISTDAGRFYRPAYIGPRGWVGLRLDVAPIDWAEVASFVTDSYRLAAPKHLAALLTNPPDADRVR